MAKSETPRRQTDHLDNSECGFCNAEDQKLSRRHFLFRGAAGFLGLGLTPQLLYAAPQKRATADSVILVWLGGGPSHIDMWDPKPGRPTAGEFKPIKTAADGIQIGEHLPRIAKLMDKASLIRSFTSREGSHERGTYLWHTGYSPLGSIEHPTVGAIIAKETPEKNKELPAYVSIRAGRLGAGYLGAAYAPYMIGDAYNPTANLRYHRSVSARKFQERLRLLNGLNKNFGRQYHREEALQGFNQYYKDAYTMMRAKSVAAFDVDKEPGPMRAKYGRHQFGQSCLLARRLVEVGVRFVEVSLGGWDTHENNFARVKSNLGTLDPTLSTLISDLDERGLLKRTMIVCMGEFGRTPRINGRGGRDHWARCWSGLIAGGGVKGGRVIGASDRDGGQVKDRAVRVGDLHATIFQAIGVDLKTEYTSPEGRPFAIVGGAGGGGGGKPINELF